MHYLTYRACDQGYFPATWEDGSEYFTMVKAYGIEVRDYGVDFGLRDGRALWSAYAIERGGERYLGDFETLCDAEEAIDADAASCLRCDVSGIFSAVI